MIPLSEARARILAVDDVDINREIIAELLTREGADLTMADSGKQAADETGRQNISDAEAEFSELFGAELDSLSHGVLFSLGFNLLFYILGSFLTQVNLQDRLQAVAFVKPNLPVNHQDTPARRIRIRNTDLRILLERFVGANRASECLQEVAAQLHQAAFIVERSGLRVDHFGVAGGAGAVAVQRQRFRLARRFQRLRTQGRLHRAAATQRWRSKGQQNGGHNSDQRLGNAEHGVSRGIEPI